MINPHLNEVAVELNIPESEASGYAILCLHGRNQSPAFMQDIIEKLGWQKYPVLYPKAADKSWYPKGFKAPIEENQPNLDYALSTVKHFHQKLNALGFKNDQIILMGFSQGACLMAQYALLNPHAFKNIIILTGGYIGPEGIEWNFKGDFKGTPVYITTSEIDEWVPVKRTKETAAAFEQLNAKVTLEIFQDRPHEVSQTEIQKIAKAL